MAGLARAVARPLVARAQQTDRVVRSDLHPEIVYLLLRQYWLNTPSLGFFSPPVNPKSSDPEYPLAESGVEFYKNGPSFMQRHVPLWLSVHIQRSIAVLATVIAKSSGAEQRVARICRWRLIALKAFQNRPLPDSRMLRLAQARHGHIWHGSADEVIQKRSFAAIAHGHHDGFR
jgi:hypothetical protein